MYFLFYFFHHHLSPLHPPLLVITTLLPVSIIYFILSVTKSHMYFKEVRRGKVADMNKFVFRKDHYDSTVENRLEVGLTDCKKIQFLS